MFPQWKLVFAGSDMGLKKNRTFKRQLQQQALDLGVNHKIEWMDAVTDPAALYSSCAFTLNFSESESFSLTCMESLYAGRPVIATRSGGPVEIIDDTISGMLVNRGDVVAMSEAMRKIMSDTELRSQMSVAAYSRVRSKFGAANTYEKLAAVYFSLARPNKGDQKRV